MDDIGFEARRNERMVDGAGDQAGRLIYALKPQAGRLSYKTDY